MFFNTKGIYRDYDVEVGKNYAYWVETGLAKGRITGPVGVRIRDPRVWWHYDKIQNEMKKIKNAEIIKVGETVHHLPLNAILAGNRAKMVLGLGVIHAGESGPEILLSVLKRLTEKNPDLLDKVGFAILPNVNADMREELACGLPKYYRVNRNGVDLNRNFNADWNIVSKTYGLSTDDPDCVTYRGVYPESEPETKAVVHFIKSINPSVILSYHALASVTCDSLLASKNIPDNSECEEKFEKLARAYSDAFRIAAGEPVIDGNVFYKACSPGSLGEWSYQNGYISFDLELNDGGSIDDFARARRDLTDVDLLNRAIEYHYNSIVAIMQAIVE